MLSLLRYLLFPFSILYSVIFYLVKYYAVVHQIPGVKVISIGNLTTGGTGKTPHVIYIANLVKKNVAVLTRGYGGSKTADGIVVELDTDPTKAGDEPVLIKKSAPFVTVIAGKNRYLNFMNFPGKNTIKTILLDDGFQHHRIARDLDIVLIDSIQGLRNNLLPMGNLREPLSALKRAHVVIFTKSIKGDHQNTLYNKIKGINPELKVFYSRYTPVCISNGVFLKPMIEITDKRVLLFSGIAAPTSFINMIAEHNPSKLDYFDYNDHKKYSSALLKKLLSQGKDYDLILCTEKDYVKIEKMDLKKQIYFLKISLTFENEHEFNEMILKTLENSNI